MASAHLPVLYAESLHALAIRKNGFYVDATFGRGGHSRGILQSLGVEGRLLAIDRDPRAVTVATNEFGADARFSIRWGAFSNLEQFIDDLGKRQSVAGILMDLGVSSPQLDDPARGFSFMRSGPLDMRMNNNAGLTAETWLTQQNESSLTQVLKEYGEERFARRVARAILAEQKLSPITTTEKLASIVREAIPVREKNKDPATRSFQAIRIAVNDELGEIRKGLAQAVNVLETGGRLVVISFHSLEDRIVKRFMRDQSRNRPLPKRLPVMDQQELPPLRIIGKPVHAGEAELDSNPRARSAVMRVAEKQV